MFNFAYCAPTSVVFGPDKESQVGSLVKEQGCKKVLIHYGGGSVVKSGLLDRVKASLEEAGVAFVELGGVAPNPRLSLVNEGAALSKKEGVDFILAVGGGSVIDSAKGIGYAVLDDGDVWDFYTRKRVPSACVPVGCVLTIAAAGSEMSGSTVVTNEDGNVKIGYGNNMARPVFAIMNPELTKTLPAYQTGSGCVDILMHTLERYFSPGNSMEITDSISEALMRTVIKYSYVLFENPDDSRARAEIMWAGSLSHNGLTGCGGSGGDWATHVLEQEISGLFDVAHGAGMSAIWASWARIVCKENVDRFYTFATNVMGIEAAANKEEVALKGIKALDEFFRAIEMPTNFKELGVIPTEEDIQTMVNQCWITKGGKVGAVKVLTKEDMANVYRGAL